MNRRGTVLIATLLALLLSGALATAALAAARLRMLAGLRSAAAVRATLAVGYRVESRIAALDPVAVESLTPGLSASLGEGDSITRLGADLYQLRVVVEERLEGGAVIARDGAAQLLVLEKPCPAAARLQPLPGPTDGMDSMCVDRSGPEPAIPRFRRVPGGWWRGP